MIHKLLAGKGRMKKVVSLLLCLALLGGSVISSNVTAEAEGTTDNVEAAETVDEGTTEEIVETTKTVEAVETVEETPAEETAEETTEAVANEDGGIATLSLDDDDNDGISLTAGNNQGGNNQGGNNQGGGDHGGGGQTTTPSTIYVWYDRVTVSGTTLTAQDDSDGIASVTLDGSDVPQGNGGSSDYQSSTSGLPISSPYSTSGQTVTVTVTPEDGYYITFISVNCCGSGAATSCTTYASGGAYTSSFTVSDAGAITRTITLDAENGFHHDSNASNYFILIGVAPIPSPLYVEYDYGNIVDIIGTGDSSSAFSTADGWTTASNSNKYGEGYNTSDTDGSQGVKTANTQYKYAYSSSLTSDEDKAAAAAAWKHYANTITDAAKEQAAAAGYVFAGWKAEYYTSVTVSNQTANEDGYQDAYNNWDYTFSTYYGSNTYDEGDTVALTTNVRLIAQWIPIGIKVTKTVSGIANTEVNGNHTYTLQLYRSTDDGSTWTAYGDAVELTVDGDGSASTYIYPLPAGTYKVEETSGNGNLTGNTKTYYITVSYGENATVTYNSSYSVDSTISETTDVALLASELSVTNSYSETPITTEVSVEKVWNDNNNLGNVRPNYVTVTLYADGVATDQTLELNKGNGWKGTFTDLQKYSGQTEIVYTVQEGDVEYYTAEVTGSASEGYTITNTVNTMSVTVIKYITGNMGDTSKSFSFTLTNENGTAIVDGFSLKDYTDYPSEGSKTVTGLAIGSTIYLTEENGVYTPTVVYNGQKITADEETGEYAITLVAGVDTITVTNEYNIEPDTGINLNSAPYILMLAGVVILGGVVLFRRRRRLL